MSLTPDQIQRYARHIVLRDIGGAGQNALLKSNIAIVGAGGLGGPAGLYLAAAGVGRLTLIDDDVVELSNLQRQIQFLDTDINAGKAETMARSLKARTPDIGVNIQALRLTQDNALDLLKDHDVILDGTDLFSTRLIINQVSRSLNIPLVSGALGQFDMQLVVFNTDADAPCYRCLIGDLPDAERNCVTEGVLGALAGMCGSMMAMEAIKLITKAGKPLSGRLYMFDALKAEGRTISLSQDPACPICR